MKLSRQSRLRFNLVDNAKADQEAIEKIDGVAKVLIKGGMFQVVIGMDVVDCYDEVVKLLPNMEEQEMTATEEQNEKRKAFDVVADFISSIFSPIVLVLLAQAPIEKFLNRIVPKSIRLVIVPMVEFIVMGTLALSILGPLGDYIGKVFTLLFTFLSEKVGWLECMVMGGFYSPLVIFGLHHGLAPLGTMQMSQMGYDGIFGPGVLCANIGQGTASLVSGLISKDSKTRQIGISAGITGLMGTTEPALYGNNVPKKYPLLAGMIGAACGGLYAGITHTHRYATGSSGLPAIVMYIGDDTLQYFYNILISLAITIIVAAAMTVVLGKIFKSGDANNSTVMDIRLP